MPSLRGVSGEETIRALERLGFVRVRQRGSHIVLKRQHADGTTGALFLYIASWPKEPCGEYCVRHKYQLRNFWRNCNVLFVLNLSYGHTPPKGHFTNGMLSG